jgi:predicted ArsR family transcriptional regulator
MSASTPELVLNYLETHTQATAAEIAAELHLTHADIRYHLQALLHSDAVEVIEICKTEPRGRPARVFRRRLENHPIAIATFLSTVLTEINGLSDQRREQIMRRLAEQIFEIKNNTQPSFALRILSLIQVLNKLGYQAKWEIHSGCSRVNLKNCPYRKMVETHPILCELDRLALELTAKSNVRTITLITSGDCTSCVFELDS